eukprot:727706-Pleurochrysis_carterae.AAC.2
MTDSGTVLQRAKVAWHPVEERVDCVLTVRVDEQPPNLAANTSVLFGPKSARAGVASRLWQAFPTSVRSSAFGISMGVGRSGAVVSTALGGVLPALEVRTNRARETGCARSGYQAFGRIRVDRIALTRCHLCTHEYMLSSYAESELHWLLLSLFRSLSLCTAAPFFLAVFYVYALSSKRPVDRSPTSFKHHFEISPIFYMPYPQCIYLCYDQDWHLS